MLAQSHEAGASQRAASGAAGAVGETGYILGFAGLLPQIAAVAALALGMDSYIGHCFAFAYAGLVFSFVGGAWWGLAVQRSHRQGVLLMIAVVPSLLVAALALALVSSAIPLRPALVVLGAALMLMLPMDRNLVHAGDAPAGWMMLRTPLSLGLGALTLIAGAIA